VSHIEGRDDPFVGKKIADTRGIEGVAHVVGMSAGGNADGVCRGNPAGEFRDVRDYFGIDEALGEECLFGFGEALAIKFDGEFLTEHLDDFGGGNSTPLTVPIVVELEGCIDVVKGMNPCVVMRWHGVDQGAVTVEDDRFNSMVGDKCFKKFDGVGGHEL